MKRVDNCCRSSTNSSSSRLSSKDLNNIVERLKNQCHHDSTRKQYYQIWKQFANFILRLDFRPSEWEQKITLFIALLIDQKKQSATVRTYLSAFRVVLKIGGIKLQEDLFLINSLTRACKITNDRIHARLPISKAMLNIILKQVKTHFEDGDNVQLFLSLLYQTMFSTAYYGMLKVGEVTLGSHPILAKDVHIGANKEKLMLILHSLKTHAKCNFPQMVKISSTRTSAAKNRIQQQAENQEFCPYMLIRKYANLRGPFRCADNEPFFTFAGGVPVKPIHMNRCLKTILGKCGFDPIVYSVHSLRVGRSVDLLKLGLSVETIKKLGRWKSNAVFQYLKYY